MSDQRSNIAVWALTQATPTQLDEIDAIRHESESGDLSEYIEKRCAEAVKAHGRAVKEFCDSVPREIIWQDPQRAAKERNANIIRVLSGRGLDYGNTWDGNKPTRDDSVLVAWWTHTPLTREEVVALFDVWFDIRIEQRLAQVAEQWGRARTKSTGNQPPPPPPPENPDPQ